MISMADCLAIFTVASVMNDNAAAEKGRAAVAAYERDNGGRGRGALCELRAEYEKLRLDSTSALEIMRYIDHRIESLEARHTLASSARSQGRREDAR